MAKFIKVHDKYNNLPIIVNVDNIGVIEYVEDEPQKKMTRLYFITPITDNISSYCFVDVNETVERIEDALTK